MNEGETMLMLESSKLSTPFLAFRGERRRVKLITASLKDAWCFQFSRKPHHNEIRSKVKD